MEGGGTPGPSVRSPPTLLLLGRSPNQTTFSSKVHFLLFPLYGFQCPTSPRSYTSSYRNREAPHPLDPMKRASYSSWSFPLFQGATPMWACVGCGVLLSRL